MIKKQEIRKREDEEKTKLPSIYRQLKSES